jgi:hypothetical protein
MNPADPFFCLPKGRTEYFRNGVAVVPLPNDPDPGLAIIVIDENKKKHSLNCNCRIYKKKGHCKHAKEMAKAFRQLVDTSEKGSLEASSSQDHLHRLASVLHDACPADSEKLILETDGLNADETQQIRICRSNGDLLVTCFTGAGMVGDSGIDEAKLFAQRTGLIPLDGDPYHRGRIFNMLSLMTMTDTERVLHEKGMKSRRQVFEESFWHRLAYHFRNIYGLTETSISAEIEQSTGRFLIRSGGIEIVIPRQQMMRVRRALTGNSENQSAFKIWPESLESIVKVTADESNNLNIVLYLLLHLPDGSTQAIERQKLKQFWYNDTVYIPEKEVFATWRKPDRFWDKFGGKYSKKIKQKRLPEVIEKIGDIFAPPNIVDQSVNRLANSPRIQPG